MIRILIADDHQMFLDGISALLEDENDIHIAGTALNGREVIDSLKKTEIDVVLLDIKMPVLGGLETNQLIQSQFPEVKVLILTMFNEYSYISQFLQDGVSGYILKNTGRIELVSAIKTVASGKLHYSQDVADTLIKSFTAPEKKETKRYSEVKLTKRETEVLKLIAQELTTVEIAKALFISQHTVETHRKNLLSKLDVRNTAGLVKYAVKTGLVE